MNLLFDAQPGSTIPVLGSDRAFPVHRIYCVGKNYADHIREMGMSTGPLREEPCFFLKPGDTATTAAHIAYPPGTSNLHYEGELVLAIGRTGRDVPVDQAAEFILGYAAGLDMTRRDLQMAASRQGLPWDTGKSFEQAAPVGPIRLQQDVGELSSGSIRLWVNEQLRQHADLADLIWNCSEIVAQLSTLYTLQAGDLIFTGTPAGVGAVQRGDRIRLAIDGLPELAVELV